MSAVAELIERLRSHMGKQDVPVLLADCRLAADALEAAEARAEELEKALAPFAAYIKARDENDADIPDNAPAISYATSFRGPVVTVRLGDFRRARALSHTLTEEGKQ